MSEYIKCIDCGSILTDPARDYCTFCGSAIPLLPEVLCAK